MSFAIGLRFYRVGVRRKADKTFMVVGVGATPCDLLEFAESFVTAKATPTVETSESRTWFFETHESNGDRVLHGYINYGTHGFESKFKDVKTRKEKYNRKATDLEEIPLYFQIWAPDETKYALMAFQSFQGRSCVTFVRTAMTADFEKQYPEYTLTFAAVAPAASMLDMAPVKTVTFLKPRALKDKADKYLLGRPIDEVEYEVTLRARRRGSSISTYKELRTRFDDQKGFVTFEGQQFEGVKADVKIGSKRRTVGVYGSGYDAGLIDVSDDVNRAPSGHPTFESICAEVDGLMDEFYAGMG
ncbi:hypothetical protein [Tardiphaga sp.]|uniref:hypothetical protein n=1 Tax=Tardiphaga sp. TaxID=1926292 RepID=UPI002630D239|nr:hypothetical protein [Tardiphaga sp.]MDB5616212.1 hypothetical protein [Tardiphaga sp.]